MALRVPDHEVYPAHASGDAVLARASSVAIVLRGATWADLQRMLEMRGDKGSPRFAFDDGSLEIMSPSRTHEHIKSMIGCLVEAFCMERGLDITPYGSWTLEDKAALAALEPDECYVLGDVKEPARPDLAIEVALTSGGLEKLAVYRRLGIREVWIWKGGALTVHELRGDRYEVVPASVLLPGIDLAQLLAFVDTTPMTKAVRAYREALR